MNGRELPQSNEGLYKNHSQSQAASEWMFSFEGGKKTRVSLPTVYVWHWTGERTWEGQSGKWDVKGMQIGKEKATLSVLLDEMAVYIKSAK